MGIDYYVASDETRELFELGSGTWGGYYDYKKATATEAPPHVTQDTLRDLPNVASDVGSGAAGTR